MPRRPYQVVRALARWLATLLLAAPGPGATVAQTVTGAGGSFPNPMYSQWFAEFGHLHPGIRINYQPIGSGAGIRQVSRGVVDFGATDAAMTDAQLRASPRRLLHIPTLLGAVVPVYNLPGVPGTLRLAPDVLADIFTGALTRWDDPRLLRDNPGLPLPHASIVPVYRADGSGSTFIFTDYLCKVSSAFERAVGRGTSVAWPVGVGQKGSEAVAGFVRGTPNAIGYVEQMYVLSGGMKAASVRNAAGQWVQASDESVAAAAMASLASIPADFRVSIVDAPGAGSFPIVSFTWLLVPVGPEETWRDAVMREFLLWMLEHGEAEAARAGYAPLPASLAMRVKATVEKLPQHPS